MQIVLVALLIVNFFNGSNLIEKRICAILCLLHSFFSIFSVVFFLYALLIKLFLLDIQRHVICKVYLFPAVCIVLVDIHESTQFLICFFCLVGFFFCIHNQLKITLLSKLQEINEVHINIVHTYICICLFFSFNFLVFPEVYNKIIFTITCYFRVLTLNSI